MTFRWDQPVPAEWRAPGPPPVWAYLVLFVAIEVAALAFTIMGWPQGKPVILRDFALTALLAPFVLWVAASLALYGALYDTPAYDAAVKNGARWRLQSQWQQQACMGMVVLDSVILTPEPDLAERMLKLEGRPPENPGRCMALDSIVAADGAARVRAVLTALLTPLVAQLTQVARRASFGIVMQCERGEWSTVVLAAWTQLQLPGQPRTHWAGEAREPDFAHGGLGDGIDCQLVLAWHLNPADKEPDASEAAVALLLGSPALLRGEPDLKHQAWLLRQSVVADAAQADSALARLLAAQQVPRERIHHFWYSRLEGLAQHASLGALRDSGLKLEEHALDQAIGPQAPVARWVLQALAARMVLFGQGAQLVALPHEKGVAFNLVVKAPAPAVEPWKAEYAYEYGLFPGAQVAACVAFWLFLVLVLPGADGWNTTLSVFTCVLAVVAILCVVLRFVARRNHINEVWQEYEG